MIKQILFSGLLVFSISCSNTKKMQEDTGAETNTKYAVGEFDNQGHRGCRGLMPENTVPAMLNVLGMNVSTLEMDVVITKDQKVILSHEPFFNHEITTKPDGSFVTESEEKSLNIYNMTYEEVQQYDVGMKPHPRFPQQQKMKVTKPLLSEVVDSINKDMMYRRRPPLYYNIETKTKPSTDNIYHPEPAEFVELLMTVIKEKYLEERVIIQSFDFRTLQYLHNKYPHIKTAMLIEGFDKRSFEGQLKDLGFTPTIYSPAFELVNNKLIEACHSKNIKVIPWTVNDKPTIDKLKQMGVDGIITDYPNLFSE